MKWIILFLGLFLISFTSAGLFDNYQVRVSNIGTSNEDLTLTTSKGEINTYLVRESNILGKWVRVRGTFYSEYENKFGRRVKFGNSDPDVAINFISKYRYYFTSTMPYYEKEGQYFFYDGNVSNKEGFIYIDLNDICLKEFSDGNITADCKVTMEKKNRIILPDQYIIMVEFNSDRNIDPNFAGGTGTSIDPYQITNWTALNDTRSYLTSHFILNANLSSSDADYINPFVTIGNSATAYRFSGSFNGNGNTISDLIINQSTDYAGLFGYVTGNVSNLGTSGNITCASYCGMIAGYMTGRMNNSNSAGNVTTVGTTKTNTGGLIGYYSGVSLNYSSSSAEVSGYRYVGGLVGQHASTTGIIQNSYSTGNIIGTNTWNGGIVGYTTGSVRDCNYSGNISGYQYVGGIAGRKETSTTIINNTHSSGIIVCSSGWCGGLVGRNSAGTISFSFSNASVISGISTGGFVGYAYAGTIQYCYATGNVTGSGSNGGFVGSTGTGQIIDNCYSTGNVVVNSSTLSVSIGGGFAGDAYGKITNSYSTGNVWVKYDTSGSFIGSIGSGTCNINNTFSTGTVSGTLVNSYAYASNSSATNCNVTNSYYDSNLTNRIHYLYGTGLTTEQMKNISTYTNWTGEILLTNISRNNGYPFLGWEVGNSTKWLIWDGIVPVTNCWTKTGNILFVPKGCVYNVLKGVVG